MSVAGVREPLPPAVASGRVLEVDGLRITRDRGARTDTIVSSVSLSLAAGETIGIVGESGSGKSMTAKAITGLLPPTVSAHGEIRYKDRNLLALREREWRGVRGREIGMILQDPFTMLNPVMRCGRILGESLRAERRLSRAERRAESVRRLAEVGISDETVVDRYPFQLSGGMRQRIAIAAALARDPEVLIADEPSTALDAATQREVLALIKGVQEARQMGLILITHDLRVAFAVCSRVYVLYAGSLIEVGASNELEREPLHPYSQGLLLSEPSADRRVRELPAIPGSVPAADEVAGGCTFAPRCRWAVPVCSEGAPPLREVSPGRLSACVRLDEIRVEMHDRKSYAEAETHAPLAGLEGEAFVSARDVRKTFVSGGREMTAVDGVSIEIGRHESVGIVGESGSGKTTLARMLVGLERASSGEIEIDGVAAADRTALSADQRRQLTSSLQIVFQDPYSSLNPMRTIGWTLAEAVSTHDAAVSKVEARVAELLDSVGLSESYAQRRPAALSGGERQRVAIARALAVRPKMLVCDEPVSALDVSVQAQILNLLTSLREERGLGYVFITHDLSIVRQVSERLYVMCEGRIVESGPTDQVLERPSDPYTIKLLASVPGAESD